MRVISPSVRSTGRSDVAWFIVATFEFASVWCTQKAGDGRVFSAEKLTVAGRSVFARFWKVSRGWSGRQRPPAGPIWVGWVENDVGRDFLGARWVENDVERD